MMRLRLFAVVHEMTLSERQQKAQGLTRWLQGMNAYVTNPMPLRPDDRLRFWVTNEDREAVLTKLRQQDWSPAFVSVHLHFHRDTLVPGTTYELDLPPDRLVQDRTIRGEVVKPEKPNAEVEGIKRYLGLK